MTSIPVPSDAESLPLRRGLTGLRMTNSSQDFSDDTAMTYWRDAREAFGERAASSYRHIRRQMERSPA